MRGELVPVWVSCGVGKGMRKVFATLTCPLDSEDGISQAAEGAAAELYDQGVIDEGEFPVVVTVHREAQSAPLGARLVDMEVRPVFTVYETGGNEK